MTLQPQNLLHLSCQTPRQLVLWPQETIGTRRRRGELMTSDLTILYITSNSPIRTMSVLDTKIRLDLLRPTGQRPPYTQLLQRPWALTLQMDKMAMRLLLKPGRRGKGRRLDYRQPTKPREKSWKLIVMLSQTTNPLQSHPSRLPMSRSNKSLM